MSVDVQRVYSPDSEHFLREIHATCSVHAMTFVFPPDSVQVEQFTTMHANCEAMAANPGSWCAWNRTTPAKSRKRWPA